MMSAQISYDTAQQRLRQCDSVMEPDVLSTIRTFVKTSPNPALAEAV
jgi:hypothetical protein